MRYFEISPWYDIISEHEGSCRESCVGYHPPGAHSKLITNHFFQSFSVVESTFPNWGLIAGICRIKILTILTKVACNAILT